MSNYGLITIGLLIMLSVPIVATDLKERRIPNVWNLALGIVGLGLALVRAPHWSTAISAAVDFAETLFVFLALVTVMRLLKRPDGLGMGDVKFLAAASFWVGFGGVALLFLGASVLAVVTACATMPWRGLDLKSPRPFGPMLAASLVAVAALLQFDPPHA